MDRKEQLSQWANELIHVIHRGQPGDARSLERAHELLTDLAGAAQGQYEVVAEQVEISSELSKWLGNEYPYERNRTYKMAAQLEQQVLALFRAVVGHLERA